MAAKWPEPEGALTKKAKLAEVRVTPLRLHLDHAPKRLECEGIRRSVTGNGDSPAVCVDVAPVGSFLPVDSEAIGF